METGSKVFWRPKLSIFYLNNKLSIFGILVRKDVFNKLTFYIYSGIFPGDNNKNKNRPTAKTHKPNGARKWISVRTVLLLKHFTYYFSLSKLVKLDEDDTSNWIQPSMQPNQLIINSMVFLYRLSQRIYCRRIFYAFSWDMLKDTIVLKMRTSILFFVVLLLLYCEGRIKITSVN